MIIVGLLGIRQGWEPQKLRKISFWLTFQLFVVMGFAFSLLSPWPYIVFPVFMVFSILILLLSLRLAHWIRRNMEQSFGLEYWKKPGTRGKLFPFLYLDKFKRLKQYNERLEANPADIDAWEGKGTLLKELGEEQEARSCYAKAKELQGT